MVSYYGCSAAHAFPRGYPRTLVVFGGLFLVVYIILLCISAIRFFLSKHKSKALVRWWAFPVSALLGIMYAESCPEHMCIFANKTQ